MKFKNQGGVPSKVWKKILDPERTMQISGSALVLHFGHTENKNISVKCPISIFLGAAADVLTVDLKERWRPLFATIEHFRYFNF